MIRNAKMIEPISGFQKIYPLNGYKIDEKLKLSKYISFKRLKDNVDEGKIVFVSPKLWEDPFEQIYYSAENFEKYNYEKPNIFCMCLTGNPVQNEAAAWKMYQDGTEKMVLVVFNAMKMLCQLDKFCKNNHSSIYIGEINYSFSAQNIKNLSDPLNSNYKNYFPENFSNKDYLNLLLLKRKAFKFENEVRIFVIPDDRNSDDSKKTLYEFPFNYNEGVVYALKIAPLQPFSIGDPRQEYYEILQKTESLIYKKALKNLFPKLDSRKIVQSLLYKPREIKEL